MKEKMDLIEWELTHEDTSKMLFLASILDRNNSYILSLALGFNTVPFDEEALYMKVEKLQELTLPEIIRINKKQRILSYISTGFFLLASLMLVVFSTIWDAQFIIEKPFCDVVLLLLLSIGFLIRSKSIIIRYFPVEMDRYKEYLIQYIKEKGDCYGKYK